MMQQKVFIGGNIFLLHSCTMWGKNSLLDSSLSLTCCLCDNVTLFEQWPHFIPFHILAPHCKVAKIHSIVRSQSALHCGCKILAVVTGGADQSRWSARRSQVLVELSTATCVQASHLSTSTWRHVNVDRGQVLIELSTDTCLQYFPSEPPIHIHLKIYECGQVLVKLSSVHSHLSSPFPSNHLSTYIWRHVNVDTFSSVRLSRSRPCLVHSSLNYFTNSQV